MRSLFVVLVLLVACGCDTAAVTESEQLERNKPIKIAESDGVTVWKVTDITSRPYRRVYYTTPGGSVFVK